MKEMMIVPTEFDKEKKSFGFVEPQCDACIRDNCKTRGSFLPCEKRLTFASKMQKIEKKCQNDLLAETPTKITKPVKMLAKKIFRLKKDIIETKKRVEKDFYTYKPEGDRALICKCMKEDYAYFEQQLEKLLKEINSPSGFE